MFDDAHEQANGHFPHLDDVERLSTELEPVHALLAVASERWRSSLPAADRLAAFARDLPSAPAARSEEIRENTPLSLPLAPEVRATSTSTSAPRRRPRPLPAIAAAVIVVALLAGLLVHVAQSRLLSGLQQPTVTASIAPTATVGIRAGFGPITGRWSATSLGAGSTIVVSLSNPQVLYRDGTQLQRSNDGGKTWRTIPTPLIFLAGTLSMDASVQVMVSTDDPNTIVAQMQVPLTTAPSNCPQQDVIGADMPVHGGILANGVSYCAEAFASRDAGLHWQLIHVPTGHAPDLTGAPSFGRYLLAQGSRLYGSIMERGATGQPLGVRIVVSDDGANWRFADETLRLRAAHICDFRPVPASARLYAVTLSRGCSSGWNGPHQIWRSDDGGAHWNPVDSVSAVSVAILGISPEPDTGTPVLYVGMSDSTVKDAFRVHVVREAAQVWLQATSAGIPSGQEPIFRVFGTLADGSIVEAYADRQARPTTDQPLTLTLYAWRIGDSAWRRIAPSISVVAGYDTTFVATQTNSLWLIARSYQGNQATRTAYSFAA